MPSAKSESVGLVLFSHTTSCISTLFIHVFSLCQANLYLWQVCGRTLQVALQLAFASFYHVYLIISQALRSAATAWLVSVSAFVWIIPYTLFLFVVLLISVFVVVLEQCETVYQILRSCLCGTEARESPDMASPDRSSLAPLDQSDATTDLTLSVPKLSPSSTASTTLTWDRLKISNPLLHTLASSIAPFLRPRSREEIEQVKTEEEECRVLCEEESRCKDQMTASAAAPRKAMDMMEHYTFVQSNKIPYKPNGSGRIPSLTSGQRLGERRLPTAPKTSSEVAHSHVRRLSASFPEGGPLSSNPTVASFDVHAVTGTAACRDDETRPPLSKRQQSAGFSSSGSSPNSVAPFKLNPHRPSSPGGRDKQRIPKSRTMTVLSNLTASLSRSSLTSFSGSDRKTSNRTVSSRKISSSSTLTTLTTDTSRAPTPTSAETNPLIITAAQPSPYWTGRFQSLHDRFHNEDLQPQSLAILVSAHASKSTLLSAQRAAYQGRGNLPLSTTTALDRYGSAAVSREANLLSDDDNRCLRIFLHLDSLCATPEAQKSLRDWQEIYARRNNREALLPKGVSMDKDKGLVARIFGGRRSIAVGRPEKQVIEGKYRAVKRASIF
ncbi:hypothetical protein CkaCkLH20_02440 [Colletotrichum karsti]|uniref:Uncharacterized protein n=1 Tax=Colletotrichum karsti TaxID=1095194 RepID=A0A9P6LPJ6_9PEZI|nr:uncharacterized protein CkaCkLH20_02440 [Colletotrichum karsti]KAF9880486.1 hypothetical protein CkaCkLH20_02440 [Colletotrichum karsti]